MIMIIIMIIINIMIMIIIIIKGDGMVIIFIMAIDDQHKNQVMTNISAKRVNKKIQYKINNN